MIGNRPSRKGKRLQAKGKNRSGAPPAVGGRALECGGRRRFGFFCFCLETRRKQSRAKRRGPPHSKAQKKTKSAKRRGPPHSKANSGHRLSACQHPEGHPNRSARRFLATPASRCGRITTQRWRLRRPAFLHALLPPERTSPMHDVLSVILGGGRGTRLYPLTKKRS